VPDTELCVCILTNIRKTAFLCLNMVLLHCWSACMHMVYIRPGGTQRDLLLPGHTIATSLLLTWHPCKPAAVVHAQPQAEASTLS
jgi:hypothetical protein